MLIQAGQTLARRFNHRGKYLRSFVAPESLFIDIMMNVPIMFYAAKETNDEALYDLAVYHCRTTERTLVRPDGGTAHEGIFDLENRRLPPPDHPSRAERRVGLDPRAGLVALRLRHRLQLHQGPGRPRGRRAQRRPFHRAAVRKGSSPWDFDVPDGPDRIDDSSAGAIAASGLWNLAEPHPRPRPRRRRYRNASLTILDSLCTDHYLAWNTPGWEGVLMHGVYHFHKKLGVDESVMWGEYFFLEAVGQSPRDSQAVLTRP